MCDTDLDLDLEFADAEQMTDEQESPADDRYADVAWGRADDAAGIDATRSR